ncbi:hypothetical protein PACTADRAFT_74915 [Pachysolen tannophilus NRRL Y-2460]|uniref:diacylglycerol cholinephosphotransferase n=1 Tax=Pachysolen tannophilus NRRL Y-2460 TaxID=669874 RepID=A0A1E4U076_PACTA|nr:hypothetical protein PACTADRAFT_74915 [Pachysolen tannophilus NRRL Y-2460]
MGIFIPLQSLPNLKAYKYQGDDRSIVTKYVLKPFWQRFVKIFPLWMAPNVVTLLGFMFMIMNLLTVFYFDPYLNAKSPSWVYFSYALGLFLYQTFDACDGIHARRTGQSGPLGELFDHCIDACNTTLSVLVFASVLQLGYSWNLVLAQFASLCNFYLSTWEEFHTHILFLSEFSGPVEGILFVIFIFILTGIYGPEIWHQEYATLNLSFLPFISSFNFPNYIKIDATTLTFIFGAVGLYFNIESARRNAFRALKGNKESLHEATKGLFPFFWFYATVLLNLIFYPTILNNCLLPYLLSVGLAVAFSVGRIIIGHLTKQAFPIINAPMLIPIAQFILIQIIDKFFKYDLTKSVEYIVWTGLGLSCGIYGMFVTDIIYDITTYLDINALSIKYPKKLD